VNTFDRKFGPDFISGLPTSPGIYRIFNSAEELIYVGKAKNLRRRLGQYRNAKRRKKHSKMRSIVKEAVRVSVELYPTDLAACLAEAKIIQELRPKWNVAGAFYFLYPMIGIDYRGGVLHLLYTTEPEAIPAETLKEFSLHGAFRSRFLTGNGFFALMELLEYIGHRNRAAKLSKHTYRYAFRQMSEEWKQELELLFKGESSAAFERLVLALVENAAARRKPKKIQLLLNDIKRFWRHEAQLLHRVRSRVGNPTYPIPQKQRDILFLEHRFARAEARSS
jgi:excinuclease ABC subunit C